MPTPPTLSNETVTFKDYYRRFRKQFAKDLLRFGREQVIGALLAVAILALQLYFGLIPAFQTRKSWVSILLPYFLLIVGLCVLSALRAPVAVDRDRHKQIREQADEIVKLNGEKCRLEELLYPKVSPEEERKRKIVAEIMDGFSPEWKKIVRFIWDYGTINATTLQLQSGFDYNDVNRTLVECGVRGLAVWLGDSVSLKREFRDAIDFKLRSEGL